MAWLASGTLQQRQAFAPALPGRIREDSSRVLRSKWSDIDAWRRHGRVASGIPPAARKPGVCRLASRFFPRICSLPTRRAPPILTDGLLGYQTRSSKTGRVRRSLSRDQGLTARSVRPRRRINWMPSAQLQSTAASHRLLEYVGRLCMPAEPFSTLRRSNLFRPDVGPLLGHRAFHQQDQ